VSGSDQDLADRLVGTYRLVSVESTSDDGEVQHPFGENPDGFMTFTPEGYMLAVLARHDRPTFADGDIMGGTDQERAAAFLSASAFAGRFEVHEGRLVNTLGAATFQNWTDTVQVRDFEVTRAGLTLVTPALLMGGALRSSTVRLERIAPPT
jgi:hypothetical protein